MCGILGEYNFQHRVDPKGFSQRLSTLAHRGPDDSGVEMRHQGRVALGHQRLSIIDLSASGRQPMCNEDGTMWLVFNGEIYNFKQLRRTLEKKGHIFRSQSDSEVILHGYEEWGKDCVKHLNGIFAFAIWDEAEEMFFLARDHLGVKPLYYWHNEERLVFASEPRAIVKHPAYRCTMNNKALGDFLAYGYTPFDQCIFEGLSKLPAAHQLTVSQKKLHQKRYWQLSYTPTITNRGDAVRHIQKALENSVSSQRISDVPVCTFLSGGVDSSVVSMLLARELNDSLPVFTIGFGEPERDERPFARALAHYIGAHFNERVLTEELFNEKIPGFFEHHDEPFYDNSGIPTHFISTFVKEAGFKVVLSGDGGDELFSGYDRYDTFSGDLSRSQAWPSLVNVNNFFHRSENISHYFRSLRAFIPSNIQASLFAPEIYTQFNRDPTWLIRKFWPSFCPPLAAAQVVDTQSYLVDDILTKVDRASMACGLEVRVPLLDVHMVELAFSIDSKLHRQEGIRKSLLKQAAQNLLPKEVLAERKQGFSIPWKQWKESSILPLARKELLDGALCQRNMINPDALKERITSKHEIHLWLLLCLDFWVRRWL